MDATVDGSLSLEQQRLNISGTEQAGPYFMTKFIKGDPAPQNNVSFVDAPLGQPVPALVFIQLAPADTCDAIKKAQVAKGLKFICCNPVFVNGKQVTVAAFRK
jgi:hypothetical protein